MAKPAPEGIDVRAGQDQVAGGCVPDDMRGYRFTSQFRHSGRATLDEPIDPEAGKPFSEPAEEDGVVSNAIDNFTGQNAFGFRPQRTLAHLAALAVQGGEIVTATAAPDL